MNIAHEYYLLQLVSVVNFTFQLAFAKVCNFSFALQGASISYNVHILTYFNFLYCCMWLWFISAISMSNRYWVLVCLFFPFRKGWSRFFGGSRFSLVFDYELTGFW